MANNMPNDLMFSGSVFVFVLLFIVVIVTAAVCVNMIFPFMRERKYILAEIARTSGNEQCRWKRRLRRLYVRHIPFIGWILVRFMKREKRH